MCFACSWCGLQLFLLFLFFFCNANFFNFTISVIKIGCNWLLLGFIICVFLFPSSTCLFKSPWCPVLFFWTNHFCLTIRGNTRSAHFHYILCVIGEKWFLVINYCFLAGKDFSLQLVTRSNLLGVQILRFNCTHIQRCSWLFSSALNRSFLWTHGIFRFLTRLF